jgi:hypothetical protein
LRPSTRYSPSGGDTSSVDAAPTGVSVSPGRAVGPFAIKRAVVAEAVDDRRLVTPIDHQHLPGEVPAAVE